MLLIFFQVAEKSNIMSDVTHYIRMDQLDFLNLESLTFEKFRDLTRLNVSKNYIKFFSSLESNSKETPASPPSPLHNHIPSHPNLSSHSLGLIPGKHKHNCVGWKSENITILKNLCFKKRMLMSYSLLTLNVNMKFELFWFYWREGPKNQLFRIFQSTHLHFWSNRKI